MKRLIERFRRHFVIFLSVMGPGIITANVDNDAGGIATYSVAGAHFGYSLLWSFAPIVIGAAVILIPGVKLVPIMLISQASNGILLPFVLIFMLLLINNRRLMGEYVNSRLYNFLAIATVIVMVGLSLALCVTPFIH